MKRWRNYLFFPLFLMGLVVFLFFLKSREAPRQIPETEHPVAVRVLETEAQAVVPRALGYGQARPAMVWEAVAEVSGKVEYLHPELKKGALLKAGAELLRIDPVDYDLAVAKAEADLQALEAQFVEQSARESNTRTALKIEEDALGLAQRELKRLQKLGGATSRSAVEQQERQVLAQRQAVQSLRSNLALLPAQNKLLQAKQAAARVQLESARRNRERCLVILPMDARITAVNIEAAQFARQGTVLLSADGIAAAEVAAQIAIEHARPLLPDNIVITPDSELSEILDQLGISAVVRLPSDDFAAVWEARLSRVGEAEDPQTRTRGFIVTVDRPYEKVEVSRRPPLIRNTFVAVELRGQAKTGLIPVPRTALHDGSLYLVNAEQRLEIRTVKTAFVQGDMAVVREGLKPGEQVVLSDLSPASAGMLLSPKLDETAREALRIAAAGETALH